MWRQGICASSLTSEQADTPWKTPSDWVSVRNRQTLQWGATGLSCPLVTGNGFFEEKYARNGLKATYLGTGFDSLFLEEHGIRHMVCESVLPIGRGCWVMGGIRRSHDFETVPERFVIRDKDRWKQDYFQDEVCLVLEERGELVVIVGCSHPGILNILDTVRQRFSQPGNFYEA